MMLLQKGQLEEGVKILGSMLYVLVVLSGKFQDSCFAAGSESMSQARIVYQFIKTNNQLTGGLEDAVADLSKQYAPSKAVKVPKIAPETASSVPLMGLCWPSYKL